ncbi:MAG TPA: TPM domain-containing protein [Burkholderiaceae bacterium]|nr:TPM domain-containing protein [Burkholderiaceae bacterium]
MNQLMRWLRHACWPQWRAARCFDHGTLKAIAAAIADGERAHDGQVRFAVEGGLPASYLLRRASPRERAVRAFAKLHVWDTERNTGVLIYVNLADRDVEIVADRGVAHTVGHARWEAICQAMETKFRAGRWREGAMAGVQAVSAVLTEVAPRRVDSSDEVSNRPVML